MYIGLLREIDCRTYHNKRDKNTYILKDSREEGHSHLWDQDFDVLGSSPLSQLEFMSYENYECAEIYILYKFEFANSREENVNRRLATLCKVGST